MGHHPEGEDYKKNEAIAKFPAAPELEIKLWLSIAPRVAIKMSLNWLWVLGQPIKALPNVSLFLSTWGKLPSKETSGCVSLRIACGHWGPSDSLVLHKQLFANNISVLREACVLIFEFEIILSMLHKAMAKGFARCQRLNMSSWFWTEIIFGVRLVCRLCPLPVKILWQLAADQMFAHKPVRQQSFPTFLWTDYGRLTW